MIDLSNLMIQIADYCGAIGKAPKDICLGCCGHEDNLTDNGRTAVSIITNCMGDELTEKALMIATGLLDYGCKYDRKSEKIVGTICIELDKVLNAFFILQKCRL